ncbi:MULTISPECIES: tape measure protein [Salmonella]|uniref:Tape measure protein n=1 Tax=Salmonella enteritidis TaxID=149539 RepID=A0A624AKF3_SALEN|nr:MULTISPECIES: tape measure protein [Salmonella]EGV7969058.1 tail tape measure protein [Salmonella enterica]HDW6424185.1 tape measure protein [Salmonella enterica subsp. enterica serovar Typhi]ECI2920367.1 tape measure protein [Salmonella enterica subsp. enterica serovar Enteritidis]ECZ5195152.1 tape measure protein [Salmonella enterica subsp. enterica serovar Enteritidis]EDM8340724.1 tail tape measure protein [Salmonella enterica subsp. enterica serovar Enteritidis]
MAQFKVDDFLIELGFSSQKVLKGLEKAEKQTMQVASRIEKRLNKAFKVNPTPLNDSLKVMERNVDKTVSKIEQRLKNTRVFKIKTEIEDTLKPLRQPRQPRISGNRAITAAYSANMSKLKGFDPILQKYIKSQFYGLSAKAGQMDNSKFNEKLAQLNASVREAIAKARGHTSTSKNNHSEKASNGLDVLATSAIKAGTAIYSFQTALEAYKKVMEVGLKKEASQRAAQFVLGDEGAKRATDFVKNLANNTGVDQIETLSSFAKFSAGAGDMDADQKESLFSNVIGTSRLMGLSTDEINGILKAFEQMASKGKIQAEELRGQLGDRMAGAFQLFARSLGMTTEQLDAAMKNGKVLSKDVLPKVSAEMGRMIDKAGGWEKIINSTQTQLGRLSNSWNNNLALMFDGSQEGLVDFTRSLTNLLNSLGGQSKNLGEHFGDLMKSMSNGIDDLTTISYRVQGFFDRVTLAYRELNDTQKAVADGIANGLLSALKGLAGIVAVRSGIGAVGGIWSLIRAISTLGNVANTAAGRINSRSGTGSVEGGKGKLSVADAITKVMIVGMATDVINAIVKPFYERQMSKSDNPIDKVVRSKVEPTDQALTGDMNSLAAVLWAMVQGKSKDVPQFSPEALNNLKGRVETFTQDLKVIKPSVNIQPQTINITTQTVLDGKVIDERTTSHINRMQEDTLISSAYPEE